MDRVQPEVERDVLLARERAAREEAEAAVRARDDILAIVSHDLRTPLSTIGISLAIIEAAQGDPLTRAQAGIIRRAIGNMSRLIQDLQDVNQIAAGQFVVSPKVVEVEAILEEARTALAPLAEHKGQHLDIARLAGTGAVVADRGRVGQVLANLVGNAMKFTPEGGHIALAVEPGEREVLFRVTDTGPGIEAQDVPHIFDRFWQVRRLRRGGVGLGLAITKGIVEAHGGRIWARSTPGLGSEFSFTLPRPASAWSAEQGAPPTA